MHEIEKNMVPRGCASLVPPLDPPLQLYSGIAGIHPLPNCILGYTPLPHCMLGYTPHGRTGVKTLVCPKLDFRTVFNVISV